MNIEGKEAIKAGVLIALLLIGGWLLVRLDAARKAVPIATAPAVAEHASAKRIRLVADEWCPVSCDESEGEPAGYGVDIAREVFTAAGYQVEYNVQPWARAVSETHKGSADAIVGMLMDAEPNLIYPSESIGNNVNVFFTLASHKWTYKNIASLDGMIVGVANEYVFGEPFDSYVRQYTADPHRLQVLFTQDPVMQGIGLLKAERIGAYLDDRMVVNWNLKQHKIDVTLREAGYVSSIPLYVAFSPANPRAKELAAAFDNGIRALRGSGKLGALLEQYGLKDWENSAEESAEK